MEQEKQGWVGAMTNHDDAVDLKNLIRLQELELELIALRKRVARIPDEIGALDSLLEEEQRQVDEAKEAIENTGKARRHLESEVESLGLKLSHYQDQLMQVKTNTEYQAVLHEIDFTKKKVEAREDQILEQMMAADEGERVLREVNGQFGEKKAEVEGHKQELVEFLKRSESKLCEVQQQVELVREMIPQEYLDRYKRIAAVRNGIAVAPVVGGICQGCHVRLRPQLLAEVKLNRQVKVCENCSRILHFPSS